MNVNQMIMIKEAADSVKDCAYHLQDAGNELQRVIDLLNEIVIEENDMELEKL